MEMRNNGPEARGLIDKSSESVHRSVFLPLVRGVTPRALEVFDFAEQGLVTGSRDSTTVPTQALYLLNDPFVRRQALAFADRLLKNTEQNDYDRVNLAYRLAFGRPATPAEIDRANSYLSEFEAISKETFAASQKPESTLVADANPAAVAAQTASSDATGATQTSNAGGAAATQPVIPANPDDIDPTDVPVKEVVIEAKDPKTAAWTSFCQALLGTAEFRYLK